MIMGKIRVGKKTRLHLKVPRPSPASINSTVTGDAGTKRLEGPSEVGPSEVVPLPEEMMKSLPVVMLSPGGDDSSPPEVKKKRDRRRLRHERWLKKIEVCRQAQEATREAERRRQTVVVGDMQPLAAALPKLTPTTATQTGKKQAGSTTRLETAKPRTPHQTTLLSEVDHFQSVLAHPAFQEDPLGAITQHIRNATARGMT